MVNNDNLARPQELLRDNNGAQGIDGAAAGVADDMGVALLKTEDTSRVQTGIHAGHD